MSRLSHTRLVRHADGESEFVVDLQHVPLVVTTWFGSPSIELIERYSEWLDSFIEHSRLCERRSVLLDDASRARRPIPSVRGRLAKIECPRSVIADRVVVVQSAGIRGAMTALSWITGNPIKTATTLEDGLRDCLELITSANIEPPRAFVLEPALPQTTASRAPTKIRRASSGPQPSSS